MGKQTMPAYCNVFLKGWFAELFLPETKQVEALMQAKHH
jgi:hypothetical protein